MKDDRDKFRLLVFMLQKLFQAKRGLCSLENPDAIMSQELLIGGHLYLKVMNIISALILLVTKVIFYQNCKYILTVNNSSVVGFERKVTELVTFG